MFQAKLPLTKVPYLLSGPNLEDPSRLTEAEAIYLPSKS